jgi:putative N6-adenine-specific DNA methylase
MKIQLSQSGLERRLKRHLMKVPQRFFATTTPGFEKILEQEVASLPGAGALQRINGGVEFSGELPLVYHANLRLRTANRVVMRVATFTARSYPELYDKAKRLPWELYSGFTKEIAVEAVAGHSRLHHTDNIARAVFDACRDHMDKLGVAVVQNKAAPLGFLARFASDVCTLSIDSSGELLYKRGYRRETGRAPLRETVAAGLLAFSEWKKFPVVADPLCGSGTFVIESALMAGCRAAGGQRQFAFQAWPPFNASHWERLRKKAVAEEQTPTGMKFVGSDISPHAVTSAQHNAEKAGVERSTDFSCSSCFDFNKDGKFGGQGLIIANLPYGKRAYATPSAAGSTDQADFYRQWGAHLKRYCRGWNYGFVVADRFFIKAAGLKATKELCFENGGIPVIFVAGTIT